MPPPLSSPRGHRSAFRRRTDGNVASVSHGQHVLTPTTVSRLTRQHGGEQSGLVTLTFDLLTFKMASKSRVTWATSVPILVFLGLSVLKLGPMNATHRRQTDVRQKHRLMPPPIRGGHKKRSERRKHCALAVVRRSQKILPRRRPPSRVRRTAKI